jgi:hypothetical protein
MSAPDSGRYRGWGVAGKRTSPPCGKKLWHLLPPPTDASFVIGASFVAQRFAVRSLLSYRSSTLRLSRDKGALMSTIKVTGPSRRLAELAGPSSLIGRLLNSIVRGAL